jgi:mono/diheme cytochrome c family protein
MIASFVRRSSVEAQRKAIASQRSAGRTRAVGIVVCLLLSAAAALFVSERSTRAQAPDTASKPAAAPAGNAKNGKQIFEAQGCFKCHGSEGQGRSQTAKESAVPQIAPTRLALPAFLRFVRSPAGQMPPYSAQQVSDSDLADLYAFLQSLAPAKLELPATANAQNGQKLYARYGCYECHGGEAQGSVQTGGSRLGPIQIPFASFVSYVRQPAGQMPPYTKKAVPDAELADIYAFLKSRPEAAPSKGIALLNQ